MAWRQLLLSWAHVLCCGGGSRSGSSRSCSCSSSRCSSSSSRSSSSSSSCSSRCSSSRCHYYLYLRELQRHQQFVRHVLQAQGGAVGGVGLRCGQHCEACAQGGHRQGVWAGRGGALEGPRQAVHHLRGGVAQAQRVVHAVPVPGHEVQAHPLGRGLRRGPQCGGPLVVEVARQAEGGQCGGRGLPLPKLGDEGAGPVHTALQARERLCGQVVQEGGQGGGHRATPRHAHAHHHVLQQAEGARDLPRGKPHHARRARGQHTGLQHGAQTSGGGQGERVGAAQQDELAPPGAPPHVPRREQLQQELAQDLFVLHGQVRHVHLEVGGRTAHARLVAVPHHKQAPLAALLLLLRLLLLGRRRPPPTTRDPLPRQAGLARPRGPHEEPGEGARVVRF